MRLLLLFLFCYFVYRYGRFLFSQFQQSRPQQQTTHQSSSSANNSQQSRKSDDEGEYVDFEEIK